MTRVISGVPRLSSVCVCVRALASSSHTLALFGPGASGNFTEGVSGLTEGRAAPPPPDPPTLTEERGNSSRLSETSQSTGETPLWEEPGPAGGGASVEENGVGVPVGDLSHVLQDVLLGDDSQQPPVDRRRHKTKTLAKRRSERVAGFNAFLPGLDGQITPAERRRLSGPARVLQPGGERSALEGRSSDVALLTALTTWSVG